MSLYSVLIGGLMLVQAGLATIPFPSLAALGGAMPMPMHSQACSGSLTVTIYMTMDQQYLFVTISDTEGFLTPANRPEVWYVRWDTEDPSKPWIEVRATTDEEIRGVPICQAVAELQKRVGAVKKLTI